MKLIFEKSVPGRRCSILPRCDVEEVQLPQELRRQEAPALPELSEVDLSRHYTELCQARPRRQLRLLSAGLLYHEV